MIDRILQPQTADQVFQFIAVGAVADHQQVYGRMAFLSVLNTSAGSPGSFMAEDQHSLAPQPTPPEALDLPDGQLPWY